MEVTSETRSRELRIITPHQGELVIAPHSDVIVDVPVIVKSDWETGLTLEGNFRLKGYWDGRTLRLASG